MNADALVSAARLRAPIKGEIQGLALTAGDRVVKLPAGIAWQGMIRLTLRGNSGFVQLGTSATFTMSLTGVNTYVDENTELAASTTVGCPVADGEWVDFERGSLTHVCVRGASASGYWYMHPSDGGTQDNRTIRGL